MLRSQASIGFTIRMSKLIHPHDIKELDGCWRRCGIWSRSDVRIPLAFEALARVSQTLIEQVRLEITIMVLWVASSMPIVLG